MEVVWLPYMIVLRTTVMVRGPPSTHQKYSVQYCKVSQDGYTIGAWTIEPYLTSSSRCAILMYEGEISAFCVWCSPFGVSPSLLDK
jgi:hypothetical protein